jgi:peptidoglycan/xylan/chitin deacetylase (PgdA/CDA1 family)
MGLKILPDPIGKLGGGGMSVVGGGVEYSEQKTVVVQQAFDLANSNVLEDDAPINNFCTSASLYIGDDGAVSSRAYRSLLRFDLSTVGIPGTAIIDSVVLSLWENDAFRAGSAPASWAVQLRRCLQPWVVNTSTPTIYDTGHNWDTAMASTDGTDRSADVSASITLDGTAAAAFVDFSGAILTDDVKKILNGTYPNNGWLIQSPTAESLGTSRAYNKFDSTRGAVGAQHPKLTINYRTITANTAILPVNLNSAIPAILIQFDDGYSSVYTEAYRYMVARNMRATCAIISAAGYIGAGGYMTTAQLQEMYAAGWDMANHTSYGSALTNLLEAEIETKLTECRDYLDGLGLTRASRHVTYPYGATNAAVFTAMSNTAMLSGRDGHEEKLTVPNMVWNLLPSYTVPNTDSLATVKAYVDAVVASGTVATILFHKITTTGAGANEYSIADFRALIDYLYTQRVVTLTVSELYALRSGSIQYRLPWF